MSGGAAAGTQLLGNGAARNTGQQTGFLGGSGAIDGSSQSLWNVLDPGNITGQNKTPGSSVGSMQSVRNLLDPGNVLGFNQNANPNGPNGSNSNGGIPSVLPNLGPQSLIPQAPRGGFMPVNTSGGGFNAMANQGAGQLFNPAMIRKPSAPSTVPAAPQTGAANPQIAALITRFLGPGNRLGYQP